MECMSGNQVVLWGEQVLEEGKKLEIRQLTVAVQTYGHSTKGNKVQGKEKKEGNKDTEITEY